MTFHAQMPSPLGTMLLCSPGRALSGLYFIGQSDCPPVDGLPPRSRKPAGPSSGMMGGLAIRKFKVRKDQAGDLFEPAAARLGAEFGAGTQLGQGALQFMQGDTPASVMALFQQVRRQMDDYFAGRRKAFNVPLELTGTGFQKKVWEALLAIPYGATASYGDVARAAGLSAQHGRPVGTAVGRNPITIIIPCHRVLSSAGTLTGYTGGLARKCALLELEGFTLR